MHPSLSLSECILLCTDDIGLSPFASYPAPSLLSLVLFLGVENTPSYGMIFEGNMKFAPRVRCRRGDLLPTFYTQIAPPEVLMVNFIANLSSGWKEVPIYNICSLYRRHKTFLPEEQRQLNYVVATFISHTEFKKALRANNSRIIWIVCRVASYLSRMLK